jgi:hypothetical protein
MRVHPQDGFSRPGWLRCEQFGAGMITGWGAHHVDTAHMKTKRKLYRDPAKERFRNDGEANAMLSRPRERLTCSARIPLTGLPLFHTAVECPAGIARPQSNAL